MTDQAQTAKGGAYPWYVVVTLMVGYLFAFLDRTMISLLVAPIQADLAISDTQMSLLMGIAFVLFYSIASVPLGLLADRYSRKLIIFSGAVIWCAMTAACGFSHSYAQLFAARMMVGLGEATLVPSANSMIGDYFRTARLGRALSVFNLGIAAGSGISLMVGAQLLGLIGSGAMWRPAIFASFAPWQFIFILLGGLGCIFLIMLLFVREPARTGRADDAAPWPVARSLAYLKSNAIRYLPLVASQTTLTIVTFGMLSWMPSFFIRLHGWSAMEAGLSYGTVSVIASVVGMLGGGAWIDRRREAGDDRAAWSVMIYALMVALPAFVLAPLMPAAWMTLAFIALAVGGAAMTAIAAPAVLIGMTPNETRAVTLALYFLIINLFGAAVGPTAVAVMTDYVFGAPGKVGLALSVIAALGSLAALLSARFGKASAISGNKSSG